MAAEMPTRGALEGELQATVDRAAKTFAAGHHHDGVLLLVAALILTDQIDNLTPEGTP